MKKFLVSLVALFAIASFSEAAGPFRNLRIRGNSAQSQLPASDPAPSSVDSSQAVDALDEVNAHRARLGLPAFIRDEGLSMGARVMAAARAYRLLQGHNRNDFQYLPQGTRAAATGCGASAGGNWLTCCAEDSYKYAGAAYVMGRDGKRYMHVAVR